MAMHQFGVLSSILLYALTVIDIVASCSSGPIACDFEGNVCGFLLSGHWKRITGQYKYDYLFGIDLIPSAHSKLGYLVNDWHVSQIDLPNTVTSPCLSSGTYHVVFWIFCTNKDVSLTVKTSKKQVLLKDRKDSEKKWKMLSLTVHEQEQFKIIFEMVSSGYQTIGLDDIMIKKTQPGTTPVPKVPLSFPLSCQFTSLNDTCGFTLAERWRINKGPYFYKGQSQLISSGEGGSGTYALFDSEKNANGSSQLANGITSSYMDNGNYTLSFWFIAPASHSQIELVIVPVRGNESTIWTGKGKLSVWTHHSIQITEKQTFRIVLRGHMFNVHGHPIPTIIGLDDMRISLRASTSSIVPLTSQSVSTELTTFPSKSSTGFVSSIKSSSLPKTSMKAKQTSIPSTHTTQTLSGGTTLTEKVKAGTTPVPNAPLSLPLSCQFTSLNDTCGFTLGKRWRINKGPYIYKGHATLIPSGEGETATYALFDSEKNANGSSQLANGMTLPYMDNGNYTLKFWFIAPATHSKIELVIVPVRGNESIIWTGKGRVSTWTYHSIQITEKQNFRIVLRGLMFNMHGHKIPTMIGLDNMTFSLTATSSPPIRHTTHTVVAASTTFPSKSTTKFVRSTKSSSMPKTNTKGKPTSIPPTHKTTKQTQSASTSTTVHRTTQTTPSVSTTAKYSAPTVIFTSSMKYSSMSKMSTKKRSTSLASSQKTSTLSRSTTVKNSSGITKHRTTTTPHTNTQSSTKRLTRVIAPNITTNAITKTRTKHSPSAKTSTTTSKISTTKSVHTTKRITKFQTTALPSHTQTSVVRSILPNTLSTNISPLVTSSVTLTSKNVKRNSLITTKYYSKATLTPSQRSTRASTARHTATPSSTKQLTKRSPSTTIQTTIASIVPLTQQSVSASPSLSSPSSSSRVPVVLSTEMNSTKPLLSTSALPTVISTTTLETSKTSKLSSQETSTGNEPSSTTFSSIVSTGTKISSNRETKSTAMTTSVKPHSLQTLNSTSHVSKTSSSLSTTKTFHPTATLSSSDTLSTVTKTSDKASVTTPITTTLPKTKENTNATVTFMTQTVSLVTKTSRNSKNTPFGSNTSVGKSVFTSRNSITALHTNSTAQTPNANASQNTNSTGHKYVDTTVSTQTSTQNTKEETSAPSTKFNTIKTHSQTTTNVQSVSSVITKRKTHKITSQTHSTSRKVTRVPLPSTSITADANPSAQKEKGAMKTTTIIGIVVGVLAALIVGLGVLYLYMRNQGKVTSNSVKYTDDEEPTFEHYTKRTSRELRLNTINGAAETNYSAVNTCMQPTTGPEPSARDSNRSFQNM